jgi:hypothetical protein
MKGLHKISPKLVLKLLILLFSMLFIPYIVLCFYAHPIADDYTYIGTFNFWDSQKQLYLQWNGRYSSNFMAMCNPMLYNSPVAYRFFSMFLLLLMPISIFFMVSSAIGRRLSTLQKIFITVIITIFILSLLPSLPEGIYWYSGSVTYILGCIMAVFYIGTAFRYFNNKFIINRLFHVCLCVLLLCLSIGFNEVQMFLLLLGHFVVWLSLNKGEKVRRFWLTMLFCCIVFSSIVFFSPGNSFRGSYFPENHRFFHSMLMSLLQMPRFFFLWISYAPLLIGSILFAPVSFKLNKRSALFRKLSGYKPLAVFALLLGILFLCIFPPYWSTAILGQHRTLNTACFFFVLVWFLFLHSMYSRNNIAEKMTQTLARPIQIGLTLLLFGSLLFSGNSGTALMEFETGKIADFDKEMNNRCQLIRIAKEQGLKEITLPPIQTKPSSLFVADIKSNCNYSVNKEYAVFGGFEKVYMDSVQNYNNR